VRTKKTLLIVLIVCLFFSALLALSCGRKEPEPVKAPAKKAELPPPKPPEPQKPPEPPKPDGQDVKEVAKPVPETQKKGKVKKRTYATQQKMFAPPVPYPKRYASPQIDSLDGLNRQFKKYHLNVWASEWSGRGILLNGYVKSEKERQDAITLAGRYNPNITDMINVVTVYDNRIPGTGQH
jgi:hypothetical protein